MLYYRDMRKIKLTTEAFTERPALDTAVSRAVLQRVSSGDEPETLRLYRPSALVAFGPQDVRSKGYAQAAAAARSGGFEAIQRLAGGRAAVFHEETIAFSWATPDPSPRERVIERFGELAGIIASALKRLGIDARVGEAPGEYCPGQYSVNARGEKKLMGVGQRLIGKAAHVGGVVVVGDSRRVRDILVPVYNALEIDWNPDTTGSVEDELGGVAYEAVQKAIVDEFASRYALYDGLVTSETIALAETMEIDHLSPAPNNNGQD